MPPDLAIILVLPVWTAAAPVTFRGSLHRPRNAQGQTPRDKSKSPGGPKGIAKGGKAAKEQKSAEKKKKEKKEPPAKPTLEDLDAELMNYTAARGAESEEAAPAEA